MATMTISALPYSLEAYLMNRQRFIAEGDEIESFLGGTVIIPDVVLEEAHTDEVQVTEHPVDVGANVADHAFRKPAVVHCRFGWSDNSRLIASVLSTLSGNRGFLTTKQVYSELLKILNARQPLRISTGKRQYPKVLLTSVKTTTTVDTEASLIVDLTFQELLTAREQIVPLEKNSTRIPEASSASDRGPVQISSTGESWSEA